MTWLGVVAVHMTLNHVHGSLLGSLQFAQPSRLTQFLPDVLLYSATRASRSAGSNAASARRAYVQHAETRNACLQCRQFGCADAFADADFAGSRLACADRKKT